MIHSTTPTKNQEVVAGTRELMRVAVIGSWGPSMLSGCEATKRLLRRGDIEIPSDLHGLEHYGYTTTPLEAGEAMRAFVRQLAGSA